jgi:glycosyltransferase involved in cell wall biosynthesis
MLTIPDAPSRPWAGWAGRTAPDVLMVLPHFAPAIGGTEGQAGCLAAGLAARGHRVTVLTLARPDAPARETREGVMIERTVTARGRGLVFAVTYGASLLRQLRRLRADRSILHAHHLYLEALAAAWVGRRGGLPAIAKVACGGADGDFARLRRTGIIHGLPLLRRLRRVVAITGEIESELLAHAFPADRIVRIPNGVDVDRFFPPRDPDAARERVGLAPESVLFLGRLEAQKGLDGALQAWSQVARRRAGAQLVLAGEGPARADLEAQSQRLGLGNSVRFLGRRADPEDLLRAGQIFLLPSRSEGMANALLEAMATGLACVATRIGGNSELLAHGVTGLLVPPGNVEALADALLALLEDPGLRRQLGTAARAAAVERYGMDRVVRRYADLYAELLEVAVR